MSDANPFSEMLGNFRAAHGLTQRKIAQAMEITDGNISKVERGIVIPTMFFVNSMFGALKMEPSGVWYEKLKVALEQARSKGKSTVDLNRFSDAQLKLFVDIKENIRSYTDEQCEAIRARLPK